MWGPMNTTNAEQPRCRLIAPRLYRFEQLITTNSTTYFLQLLVLFAKGAHVLDPVLQSGVFANDLVRRPLGRASTLHLITNQLLEPADLVLPHAKDLGTAPDGFLKFSVFQAKPTLCGDEFQDLLFEIARNGFGQLERASWGDLDLGEGKGAGYWEAVFIRKRRN